MLNGSLHQPPLLTEEANFSHFDDAGDQNFPEMNMCVCVRYRLCDGFWLICCLVTVFVLFSVCFVFQSQVQANLNQSNASGDALESILTDFDWVFFLLLLLCLRILALLFFSSSLPSPSNPCYRSWGVGGGEVDGGHNIWITMFHLGFVQVFSAWPLDLFVAKFGVMV